MESENKNSGDDSSSLHVVMFPFFAFGHISPFVQLSNKLSSHGVEISFLSAPGNVNRIKTMLNPSTKTRIINLTFPHVEGLPPGVESTADTTPLISELLKLALDKMQPQIRTLLSELKPHFVIFDFAQQWLPSMASELGIKTIYFSVFMAIAYGFLAVPSRRTSRTIEEMKLPPHGFPQTSVKSMRTFEAQDFLYMFKSFHGGPSAYDRVLSSLNGCSAILAKTCNEMEAPYIDYVKSQFQKPFLLVGPIAPPPPTDELEEKWANWLNQFAAKSVIYCSFGSETFLTHDQIQELVLGLELTGFPFFLVLNFPANHDASDEISKVLSEGFAERVRGRGIIHSGWVQQQQILAHTSVGCYVCHAGFSSVIEAILNDCQLVMLPQKVDQYLNAKLFSGDLMAGVEVNMRDEDGYFSKDDIRQAVETVFDQGPGKIIRENHKKWRDYLLDNHIHEKFIKDFVNDLKAMAGP